MLNSIILFHHLLMANNLIKSVEDKYKFSYIINQINMKRTAKLLLFGVKSVLYVGAAATTLGLGGLFYINSKIGSIDIDKEITTKYYHQKMKIQKDEANRMYYWMIWDIALMRLSTYRTYSTYCQKLNRKIISVSLQNYQKQQVLQDLQKIKDSKGDTKINKVQLYRKILKIRKKNLENFETYEYIAKEMRKQQILMDSRTIVGLDDETKRKINLVYDFLCEMGRSLKDAQILNYLKEVPAIEARFPNDYIHKVLVI